MAVKTETSYRPFVKKEMQREPAAAVPAPWSDGDNKPSLDTDPHAACPCCKGVREAFLSFKVRSFFLFSQLPSHKMTTNVVIKTMRAEQAAGVVPQSVCKEAIYHIPFTNKNPLSAAQSPAWADGNL